MKINDLIEIGIVDSLGIMLLMFDLDTGLKYVEMAVGLSLIAFNVWKVYTGVQDYKNRRNDRQD
jgi:hypothetical protein